MRLYRVDVCDGSFDNGRVAWLVGACNRAQAAKTIRELKVAPHSDEARAILMDLDITLMREHWLVANGTGVMRLA